VRAGLVVAAPARAVTEEAVYKVVLWQIEGRLSQGDVCGWILQRRGM
jgi:hypothetical protein